MLIDAGAKVNARSSSGWTALMTAAAYSANPEVIKALINAGAKVGSRTEEGHTALEVAAEHNENPEVIKALIAAGAEVDATDSSWLDCAGGSGNTQREPGDH